jgi:hypothetical protein
MTQGCAGLLELAKGRYPHLTALDVGCDQLTDSGLAHIGVQTRLQSHLCLWPLIFCLSCVCVVCRVCRVCLWLG